MLRVAFEKVQRRIPVSMALEIVRTTEDTTSLSHEFARFKNEHSMQEYIPVSHPVIGTLSDLDPRISELAIQSQIMEESGTVPGPPSARGPERLSMFLPIMTDDIKKKSSWTMSTPLRQTAYGLLQITSPFRSESIIEYRSLDLTSGRSGRLVDIPDGSEAIQECISLSENLRDIRQRQESSELQWFSYAICLEVDWAMSEERTALSTDILARAINTSTREEEYSWALIHFTAQIQATYYSLRMLKQALRVVDSLGEGLPGPLQSLRDALETLPAINEWPTVDTIPKLLESLGQAGFQVITDMLNIPAIDLSQFKQQLNRSGRQKNKKTSTYRAAHVTRGSGSSSNPFAILNQAEDDEST